MTLQQEFETQWINARPEVRRIARSYARRWDLPKPTEDFLQDVALQLWSDYEPEEPPAHFVARSQAVAERMADRILWREWRRSNLEENQPPEFFEESTRSFADVWGRKVPSEHWRFAETYSLAPLERGEWLESLKRFPIFYYLSIGASLQEVSWLTGLSLTGIRRELERIIHDQSSAGSHKRLRFHEVSAFSERRLLGDLFSIPSASSYLRKLPGYIPEWIAWFVELSKHRPSKSEPITFRLIRRLAGQDPILHEEQGLKFLLAASSETAALLTQRFIDLNPKAKRKTLWLSDIYQLLRGEGRFAHEPPYGISEERMNQIATFFSPTSKWNELKF